jgi:exosome complex exonuclease DIS3/RRP44
MMYSEAQIAIDDPKDNRPVAQGLRILMELAKILRQRRLDNGALLLASTEVC